MIEHQHYTGNFLSIYKKEGLSIFILHRNRALSANEKRFVAEAIVKKDPTLKPVPIGSILALASGQWDTGLVYTQGAISITHRTTSVQGWDDAQGEPFNASPANKDALVLVLPDATGK